MTFPILGGGQLDTGGYQIDNSLRFNDDDTPYLQRTPTSSSNRKTWTWSGWVKRSNIGTGTTDAIFYANGQSGINGTGIRFTSSEKLSLIHDIGTPFLTWESDMLFRDVSAWYHIVVKLDTTQASASDRLNLYVNGSEITGSYTAGSAPAQNSDLKINENVSHTIGVRAFFNDLPIDGYMAEINFVDGQALSPSDFGEFDDDSGIWKPKQYTGSYGTNGFYLDFENSGSLGADQSGNGNNWTPTNLASTDQTTDTPTNNFATGNPLMINYWIRTLGVATASQGNLEWSFGAGDKKVGATISTAGGKWYAEMRVNSLGSITALVSGYDANEFEIGYNQAGNRQFNRATPVSYGASFGAGDVIGFAVDQDNNQVTFYKNGASQGTLTNTFVGDAFFIGAFIYNANITFNFGQDSTFAGRETEASNTDQNGYGEFHHSVPSGYLALCTQNLATELSPTIDDGSQYFNTVLYTGNGTNPRSLTGVGFQPDFTWIKNRTDAWGHGLADSTRGGGKTLITNASAVEQTNYTWGYVDSFDSDGFTVDDGASGDDFVNQTSDNYVAWNWKANAGSTSSNTDGTITSTVQANPTAGFSIVLYSGNQTNGATVGHGLGIAPQVVIVKERNGTSGWIVKHPGLTDEGYYLILNDTDAQSTAANVWNDTNPSSTVFTLGNNTSVNENTLNYVAYCFAEIEGYSKFGKYTGNGSTDGAFVYTGFRPAWVVSKRIDSTSDWLMRDTTRDPYNVTSLFLKVNASNAEASSGDIDIVSNGFKWRSSTAGQNGSGASYIYLAFAENPFTTSTGVPVTAR